MKWVDNMVGSFIFGMKWVDNMVGRGLIFLKKLSDCFSKYFTILHSP